MQVKLLSYMRLFVIPWTVAYQAPLSREFSRQEYWSGLPFPSPGDLPHSGIKPASPALQGDSLPAEPPRSWYLNIICPRENSLGFHPVSPAANPCFSPNFPVQ